MADVSHLARRRLNISSYSVSVFIGLARLIPWNPRGLFFPAEVATSGKGCKKRPVQGRFFKKSTLSAFESAFSEKKNEVDLAHVIQDLFQRERRERKGRKKKCSKTKGQFLPKSQKAQGNGIYPEQIHNDSKETGFSHGSITGPAVLALAISVCSHVCRAKRFACKSSISTEFGFQTIWERADLPVLPYFQNLQLVS